MSQAHKHSTLSISDIEGAASAAVKRAVEARQQAGIALTDEQLNSVSGGASYYLKDPFIYGIKIDPTWLNKINPQITQPLLDQQILGAQTLVR